MNPIVKVNSGENKDLYKWISSTAIYYSPRAAPLKRRRDREVE